MHQEFDERVLRKCAPTRTLLHLKAFNVSILVSLIFWKVERPFYAEHPLFKKGSDHGQLRYPKCQYAGNPISGQVMTDTGNEYDQGMYCQEYTKQSISSLIRTRNSSGLVDEVLPSQLIHNWSLCETQYQQRLAYQISRAFWHPRCSCGSREHSILILEYLDRCRTR